MFANIIVIQRYIILTKALYWSKEGIIWNGTNLNIYRTFHGEG